MRLNLIFLFLILAFLSCNNAGKKNSSVINPKYKCSILTKGNSWAYKNSSVTDKIVSEEGIKNWESSETILRTYFKVQKAETFNVALKAKVNLGKATIKVSVNGVSKQIVISNTEFDEVFVGDFTIEHPGYYFVEFQGVQKEGATFGEISEVIIEGNTAQCNIKYIKEDFYYGRRGPSVHLNYEVPSEAKDVQYFYNEMTIPQGNDVVGSYFMATGFAEGYFGIQVNSQTERRVLFSVWSPFKTDDPKSIPDDKKIILLKKGNEVISNDFGGEGSGGQSIRVFNWKSDTTYKFLLKAKPSVNNSTDYTAYFYAPEIGEWELMASFRRPMTSTYIKSPHSFLENFIPSTGDQTRMVKYSNQWLRDRNGKWHKVKNAKFTADATARKESRLDYMGGIENNDFFLKKLTGL